MGLTRVADVLQTEGMSDALRASLWNVLDEEIFSRSGFLYSGGRLGGIDAFSRRVWADFFKQRADSRSQYASEILDVMREFFFGCYWYQVYDFIEFVISTVDSRRLVLSLNSILERELSGYRAISGLIVPITDDLERLALERALEPGPFSGATAHLAQALELFGSRESPDYRNSIKESISAVESAACELSGKAKATLGDALRVLESKSQLHGALRAGFSALYGYASDADGIRHAMLDETRIDSEDAKYFLVTCAAFVNYLKAKRTRIT